MGILYIMRNVLDNMEKPNSLNKSECSLSRIR